jgi:NADH:ubiquinone oxidoreductase subunit 6 (subunit J)
MPRLNSFDLFNDFFATIGKAVPVIKHCNAVWAACALVSIMLMISL